MAVQTHAAARPNSRIRYLWPLVIAALIIAASSRSVVASPHITNSDDKFAHFAVYGLLATLVCRLRGGWRGALWSLLVVSAFGASDEWHQSFVPGRSPDVMDWVADTTGAAIAIALYAGWTHYRRMLEWRIGRAPARLGNSGGVAPVSGS